MDQEKLLELQDFSIAFSNNGIYIPVLENISLCLNIHDIVGLLGASGSGKSVLVKSVFNAWQGQNAQTSGEINFYKNGKCFRLFPGRIGSNNAIYGKDISLIFQEPKLAFNPVMKIGNQINEVLKKHEHISKDEAQDLILTWLPKMGIENPNLLNRFPHELSGGQLQRFMVLMAVITKPKLLIADEPTTSLDTVSQKQILDIFKNLHLQERIALLIISHNPKIMEYLGAKIWQVQKKGLIAYKSEFQPLIRNRIEPCFRYKNIVSVLSLKNISFNYDKALIIDAINFDIFHREIIGIVGKSGSGKTTLAKIIVGLLQVSSGYVAPIYAAGNVQLIFQHPGAALDPSQKALNVLLEALAVAGIKSKNKRRTDAYNLLAKVGLPKEVCGKYPHQLSGGQKQRLCIARALCSKPKILVCDEAVSSLDELLKDQIIALLMELNKNEELTLVFVSHDIDLIAKVSHRILVIENGQIAEEGTPELLLSNPKSPALQQLIDAKI